MFISHNKLICIILLVLVDVLSLLLTIITAYASYSVIYLLVYILKFWQLILCTAIITTIKTKLRLLEINVSQRCHLKVNVFCCYCHYANFSLMTLPYL